MGTRKALIKIICLGILLLKINSMFLREKESIESSWEDGCECSKETVDVPKTVDTEPTEVTEPSEVTEKEPTEVADKDPIKTDTKEEPVPVDQTVVEPDVDVPANKTETTPPLQAKGVERRAGRKDARKLKKDSRHVDRKLNRVKDTRKVRKGREKREKREKREAKKGIVTLRQVAEDDQTPTDTEPQTPSQQGEICTGEEINKKSDETKSSLDSQLKDLISSIKKTQDVTIGKIDELKNSDIMNKGAVNCKGKDTTTIDDKDTIPTDPPSDDKEPTGTDDTSAQGVPAEDNKTAPDETGAGVTVKAARRPKRKLRSNDDQTDGDTESGSCYGPILRGAARRSGRKHQRKLKKENRIRNCNLFQKQWETIEKMKETAPTISNAISNACSIVRSKADENSTAQGIAETITSQTANAKGTEDSIAVANSLGNTNSLTDTNASANSNVAAVTKAETDGKSTSSASNGSVSVANNKNINDNLNNACATNDSNIAANVNTNSVAESTATANEKSLANSNSIDTTNAKSNLVANDNSTVAGNTNIGSNAISTSTSENGSKAQTVSESLGDGKTDLCADKNSKANGNLELTSKSNGNSNSCNGGNALATANSKTIGANEGTADNNSNILLNNKNDNNANSDSKSCGTLPPIEIPEPPVTPPLEKEKEIPPSCGCTETPQLEKEKEILPPSCGCTVTPSLEKEKEIIPPSCGCTKIPQLEKEKEIIPPSCGCTEIPQLEKEKEKPLTCGCSSIHLEPVQDEDVDKDSKVIGNLTSSDRGTSCTKDEEDSLQPADETGAILKPDDIFDFSTMTFKSDFGRNIPLIEGIITGNARTKNVCRKICIDMNLPRVTTSETKAGEDGLTIFRCLCGTQYTSWFKPNYLSGSLCDGSSHRLLSGKERRKLRKEKRQALRNKVRKINCGIIESDGTLKGGQTILKCGDVTPTVQPIDLKPVVHDFIDNNANSIKAQSADYLNKVQDLLASRTGTDCNNVSPK